MVQALIQFTQGATVGVAGQALIATTTGGSVTAANADDTGVVAWQWDLLTAPPPSVVFDVSVATPTATMPQPDVPGSYRVRLTVRDAAGNTDTDIRCYGVPFANGIVCPPYQENPRPLPYGTKPSETNYGGALQGWVGGGSVKQLYEALKLISAGGDAGRVFFGPIADIPAASVGNGTVYYPTDDSYHYISDGSQWWLKAANNTPPVRAAGDLSGWTYRSGTAGYASMINRGPYSRFHGLLENAAPDYVVFESPTALQTGPGGIWTITAAFRYAGITLANAVNLYQNVGIALQDAGRAHTFLFGPLLVDSFLACVNASGYTDHTRNYYSSLSSKEVSDLTPQLYTYFVRLRYDGANYISEFSQNGYDWILSTNGGTNVFKWGTGPSDSIVPATWGVGCQIIPPGLADWDILMLRQTPTNG